jgi:hypothetical protein
MNNIDDLIFIGMDLTYKPTKNKFQKYIDLIGKEMVEHICSLHPFASFAYARKFIKGRFELGEPVIATKHDLAMRYASHILKGRFELGEEAISENGYSSYSYAFNVLKKRFELGEKAIKTVDDSYYIRAEYEKVFGVDLNAI